MLSICLRRSCFRLWFIRHSAHFQYLTPSNSSPIIFCSKNSPTLSCSTNTEKRDPLILVCRVDVALQCPSRPKDHAGLTIRTTIWIRFHMKALYVPGKGTLVVQNFLTDSTDPELHPSGFDLGGRLAFNVFQYFLLLNKH